MTIHHPFEKFVRDYRSLVFQTALRLLGNFTEAQDIAQEVFLKAYQHFAEVRQSPRAGGWLRTVTRHLCLNHLTRYRCRWRFFSEMNETDSDDDFAAGLPAPEACESRSSATDRSGPFRAALAGLPQRQRAALQLFYFEELDYRQIAQRLGVSLSQVKNEMFRGRRALRRRLAHQDFECPAA